VNTPDFPSTRYLFGAGAKQIVEFKQWSREHNVYANVWYSAYPDTSVRNILTDIDIAEKIGKELDEQETLSWLRLL